MHETWKISSAWKKMSPSSFFFLFHERPRALGDEVYYILLPNRPSITSQQTYDQCDEIFVVTETISGTLK